MDDIAYQVYLDMVKDNLTASNLRLLTKKEEEIVIAHLVTTTLTFCNDLKSANGTNPYVGGLLGSLGIRQLLSIEAARKACEIHPDISTPTQEQIDKATASALSERNFVCAEFKGLE